MMKDESGEIIGESEEVHEQVSRQLSVKEYATMKNSQGGLKS